MSSQKKIFLFSGILLLLVLVGGAVFWSMRPGSVNPATPESPQGSTETALPEEKTTIVVTTTTPSPEVDVFRAQVEVAQKTDQDLDGLSDSEEGTYGTNLAVADTDEDGLLDKDEITIFHTDPLKKDSDGDGHTDGAEVRNGYNPSGSGVLILAP